MSEIALSYEVPFVDRVTMPARWARWLASCGTTPNPKLKDAPEIDGAITWEYETHGLLPWMQFFYDWRFADLTGAGKLDLILTGGAQRQIACRQDGSELWRYEEPSAGFMDIRLDTNFPITDIDADGVPELVCARKLGGALHLCVVNARTGEVNRSVPYPDLEHRPHDRRGSITVVNTSGREAPSDILVGWDYGSVALFDRELNLTWKAYLGKQDGRKHRTMGHTPYSADLDGDGRDEILAGSCLLDHDGSLLWVAPDLPALVKDGHADSVRIEALTAGERPNLLMSTGAYCFSAGGELLWGRDDLKHGQAQRVGKIRADVSGQQMVVYEAASRVDKGLPDKLIALDREGGPLWEYEVIGPEMQEGGFGFWLGDWDGDGLDEVFLNDLTQVNVIDGSGALIDTIPGHAIYVFDLVGDRRAEAVVLTGIEPGMRLQIVTNDRPNANPETNQDVSRRAATPAMYNVTRY